MSTMQDKDLVRYSSKIEQIGGCWIWTGAIKADGYGQFWLDGRMQSAHRVSYQHHIGPIPEGMKVDHLCHNRACVNPSHLQVVTHKQNMEN